MAMAKIDPSAIVKLSGQIKTFESLSQQTKSKVCSCVVHGLSVKCGSGGICRPSIHIHNPSRLRYGPHLLPKLGGGTLMTLVTNLCSFVLKVTFQTLTNPNAIPRL